MYIEPNTVIKLYKNVPLNNTYTDTLYFESRTKQNEYFHSTPSILVATLQRNSYQRVNKGRMRVSGRAENYYTVNYLAFQNSAFGSKWFYAFVNSVEYINNETVEIAFEIDVMQTYFLNGENGDVILKECLVEREHSSIDSIGSNIQLESFNPSEYVYSNYEPLFDPLTDGIDLSKMCVIIAIADLKQQIVEGHNYDNIYGGADLWVFNADDITGINTKLADYITKPESVLSIYTCPLRALLKKEYSIPNGGAQIVKGIPGLPIGDGQTMFAQLSALDGTEDFDGYVPKNKKLYTYPFNYLSIDNGNGESLPLRYEFFKNEPVIRIDCTITQPVQLVARPSNYKGVEPEPFVVGASKTLMTESLTLSNYPMCSWSYNAFENWLTSNGIQLGLSAIGNMISFVGSPMYAQPSTKTGNLNEGYLLEDKRLAQIRGANILNGATGIISQTVSACLKGDICRGSMNNSNVNIAHNIQQFYKSRVHIPGQFAKMVDDFFTMFGYATNEVKKPNTYARAEWTYTKTVGCNIIGSAPSDDIRTICNIFDNGIRFWVTPSNVGNFSLNNEPL